MTPLQPSGITAWLPVHANSPAASYGYEPLDSLI